MVVNELTNKIEGDMNFLNGARIAALTGGWLLTMAASNALAASVNVKVTDVAGKAVPDAVVYAEAAAGQALPKVLKPAEIAQQDEQFWPLVTVVQTGSQITFPNHDKLRHQVYSFSPPKVFELKLYAKGSAPPVLFDKSGTVVLGCNIHDQMIAYVQVVNTPYFAKTDAAGNARLDNLPAGKYVLKTWYYTMPANAAALEQALIAQGADTDIAVKLNVKVATE
jgi:plastocyanin